MALLYAWVEISILRIAPFNTSQSSPNYVLRMHVGGLGNVMCLQQILLSNKSQKCQCYLALEVAFFPATMCRRHRSIAEVQTRVDLFKQNCQKCQQVCVTWTKSANNTTHYVKLGKKRKESPKRNCNYIISPSVCCFVLLTRGWGRLEMRPPVALGSSPELFAFTMSLAPRVIIKVNNIIMITGC